MAPLIIAVNRQSFVERMRIPGAFVTYNFNSSIFRFRLGGILYVHGRAMPKKPVYRSPDTWGLGHVARDRMRGMMLSTGLVARHPVPVPTSEPTSSSITLCISDATQTESTPRFQPAFSWGFSGAFAAALCVCVKSLHILD